MAEVGAGEVAAGKAAAAFIQRPGVLRGLFSGGSLSSEAARLASAALGVISRAEEAGVAQIAKGRAAKAEPPEAVQRLLLAYDDSDRSQPALAWASLLRHTLPAEVVAVAVHEKEIQSTNDWLARARAQLAGCQWLHRLGQPASEIVAAAEENQVDLIVMGRYRHAALLEWLVGTTVDRVLRGTQLPVLMA